MLQPLASLYHEDTRRDAAKQARLRYVKDIGPGITRKKVGKKYQYFTPDKKRITDAEEIARINKLAIPPAYTDVWICPHANGHLQATGRDARGRKQYRYHAKWSATRSETKFDQIRAFANQLPEIRARIETDVKLPGLPKAKVVASIILLMDESNMRIGNDQYAKENGSYGLTTIRKKHVEVKGDTIRFEFIGKSGKLWQRDIKSKQIAKIVKHCEELPGQELFKYLDDAGVRHDITSDDVNSYLKEISGQPFTAKDFRTWTATALAIGVLGALAYEETKAAHSAQMKEAIKNIAAEMGHTPAICRSCYIYPAVLAQYEDGSLAQWYAKNQKLDDVGRVQAFLSKF